MKVHLEFVQASPEWVPVAELVTEYWKAIGINSDYEVVESALFSERIGTGDVQARFAFTHKPVWFLPWWNGTGGGWDRAWRQWYTSNGAQGEETPQYVVDIYHLLEQIQTADPAVARTDLYEQYKKLEKENVYTITNIINVKQPIIANAKLGNITDKGWTFAINLSGEIWYYKQ
jgi:peptide/nickel transport system substrate-binding protein